MNKSRRVQQAPKTRITMWKPALHAASTHSKALCIPKGV
mgnify:CR=1 FL=1